MVFYGFFHILKFLKYNERRRKLKAEEEEAESIFIKGIVSSFKIV